MSMTTQEPQKQKDGQAVFSKGLEKVVAGQSSICLIDGDQGKLYYRGYSIEALAERSTFEEVAYLLLKGNLPTASQLGRFKNELLALRNVDPEVLNILTRLPKNSHPMAALRTGISALAHFDSRSEEKTPEANLHKAMSLISKTPVVVAAFYRARQGLSAVQPDPVLDLAANFLYMMKAGKPDPIEARVLDQYLILLAEHSFNASTFTARVSISTLSDMYSAIVAAVGTLKGDLHGSANSRTMEMLFEIAEKENIRPYIDQALAKKKKIMGFGHRVYKGPDPRAEVLRRMARDLAEKRTDRNWYEISEEIEKVVWDRKQLYCNVDFYSAYVLYSIGISIDFFTTIFAISRMSGWTAHVIEQLSDNRLIRPTAEYVGEIDLVYRPLTVRHRTISVMRFLADTVKKFFSG